MNFKQWYKKLVFWDYKPKASINITASDLSDTWNKSLDEAINIIDNIIKDHPHWNTAVLKYAEHRIKGLRDEQ